MGDNLIQNASEYAKRCRLEIAEQLGSGIHGNVFSVLGNRKKGKTVIKVHKEDEPYYREVSVYLRLSEAGVRKLLGFNVPMLIRTDSSLRIIEMTLVTRPFVLDFAGAYLDEFPEFSAEIWQQWEKDKLDQFEERWPQVQRILRELERMGIYMVDVSPTNIAFLD